MLSSISKCALIAAFLFVFLLVYSAIWCGTPVDLSGLDGYAAAFIAGAAFTVATARKSAQSGEIGQAAFRLAIGAEVKPQRKRRAVNDNRTAKARAARKRRKAA